MINTDPGHVHTYDQQGNITCCSLEEKIESRTAVNLGTSPPTTHGHEHDHSYRWPMFSLAMLVIGLILENLIHLSIFSGSVRLIWYLVAYLPVALPVMGEAVEALRKGEWFTEFLLMSLATIGAFAIGAHPEGVAVMVFYAIGELFQASAVRKAKKNIRALLDIRPPVAFVRRDENFVPAHPEEVKVGETILVRAGEMVPLDGKLLTDKASFNAAAMTGESRPAILLKGDKILAGYISLSSAVTIQVEKQYKDSAVSRILHMVQEAATRKAKTELLIRRLAKIYTPLVTFLAVAICVVPYFILGDYRFSEWLYRALIFLVISCPCALVISIPLGYFGGLGAASRSGILFKGATHMDALLTVSALVLDKTGTLTRGSFSIRNIETEKGVSIPDLIIPVMAVESKSTHPLARAILSYDIGNAVIPSAENVEEFAGKGIIGKVQGRQIVIGNNSMMELFDIDIPNGLNENENTHLMVAMDGRFAGYITMTDQLKEDARKAIHDLRKEGIEQLVMLSGDRESITQQVASTLGLDNAIGELLPEEKLSEFEKIRARATGLVAYAGDGINDAPVLAASDVGIAMGAMGSDIAIETADVVIQADKPSKIATAIRISRATRRIIWQNIAMALGVKVLVLILGAGGLATMWEAVFADVGVALLAILNAVRIQKMEF